MKMKKPLLKRRAMEKAGEDPTIAVISKKNGTRQLGICNNFLEIARGVYAKIRNR